MICSYSWPSPNLVLTLLPVFKFFTGVSSDFLALAGISIPVNNANAIAGQNIVAGEDLDNEDDEDDISEIVPPAA